MKESSKKITIKDVARIAGVSIGTVDRVIHQRGEVSTKNRDLILRVIEEIGYKPNIYASALASNKHYAIYCLIPIMLNGEYWGLAKSGIERTIEENRQHHLSIEVLEFDQFDVNSFRKACEELLDNEVDAVLIAPMYHDETLSLIEKLEVRKIPYVFLDSKVDETNYLAYYGMPMYESGTLAASLLINVHPIDEIAIVGIERGNSPHDNATLKRKEGFMDYLAQHAPQTIIHNELIHPYDTQYNANLLTRFFAAHPNVHHIITFNSRIHLLAEYFEENRIQNHTLLGFDMLDRNVAALKKGYIRYLIAQHTETQIVQSINSLVNILVFSIPPTLRENYMPMDIIVKENVEFYKDI